MGCLALESLPLFESLPNRDLEHREHVVDEYRHCAKRWRNILALQGHSLAENYTAGRMSLVCDLDVSLPLEGISGDVGMDDQPIRNDKIRAILIFDADV